MAYGLGVRVHEGDPGGWKPDFINALQLVPNVTAACRVAKVARSTVYAEREADPEFAEAWEAARETGLDRLELELHKLATTGVPKRTVVTRQLRDKDGKLIQEEVTTTETSERHIAANFGLLKAYRPELYRDRFEHRHSGGDTPVVFDQIYRAPMPERTRELLRILIDLAGQTGSQLPVIEGHTQPA